MTDTLDSNISAIDNLSLALLKCFAIILCGYLAGRLGVITKAESKGLNTFVGTFSLPALIFTSLAQLDLGLVNWKFLMSITFAKAVVFGAVIAITLLISRPTNPSRAALLAIFATQSNDFAIGYPMLHALYETTHPEYCAYLYLMAPISLAILNPIGFVMLEIGKRRSEERTCGWSLFGSTAKGVALNPVLLMTVLGILGNLIFSHKIPSVLSVILNVFGDAFSASALFLLGLMMVGKVHTLKGAALVIPGILISIKLLVLPLVIRQSVIILDAGQTPNDTVDLSTFGFLYGTLPTAPALFVFTLRYNVDIDLIASAMVACTFLSAPLMFVSAKMIDAISAGVGPDEYTRQLELFSFDVSCASTTACLWLLVCFFILAAKKYKEPTHKVSRALIIAQLATSIGVIFWVYVTPNDVKSPLWYVQFILITGGVYVARTLTAVLAATLLFLSCRSSSFVVKFQKWTLPTVWIASFLLVTLMAIFIPPAVLDDLEKGNPNFQLGRVQAATSIVLLVFCFLVTLGCLVMQQRYQRAAPHEYSSLTTSLLATDSIIQQNIVDVEDLVSQANETTRLPCESSAGCANGTGCSEIRDRELDRNNRNDVSRADVEALPDPQILRHLALLILLLSSMFVGLALSIGFLVMEELSGIYAELAFLDVALNLGQSLITFATFGLDPGLGPLKRWVSKFRHLCPMPEALVLPNEDALSPEVKTVREQFSRRHLPECRMRLAACRRRLLRVYRGVFTGSDLVDWLLEAGLAHDRESAIRYGRCLVDTRILCHVDGTHHFQDGNLLYTFRD